MSCYLELEWKKELADHVVRRDLVGRQPGGVSLLHGCPLSHQHLHHLCVPALGGVVQGGVTRFVGCDDVRP